VHTQCGYMLSRDSLVNGVRKVLVHGGVVLKFGLVQRRMKCARNTSA
jgi:hypothetical protein